MAKSPVPTEGSAFRDHFQKTTLALQRHWWSDSPSDHAVVLISASLIESALGYAIRRTLVGTKRVADSLLGENDKDSMRPLFSFSARIKMGFCLGFYGPMSYADPETIRTIRNAFAHVVLEPHSEGVAKPLSFKHPTIVALCRKLRLPDHFKRIDMSKAKEGTHISNLPHLPPPKDSKERFEIAVSRVLSGVLYTDPQTQPRLVIGKKHLP